VVRAASEQQALALGACVESLQGHVFSTGTGTHRLSLHGWHLSRNPRARAFLARLIVSFSSSELDLRATAHIRRSGRFLQQEGMGYSYGAWCYSFNDI
jgi:hypothetical protein